MAALGSTAGVVADLSSRFALDAQSLDKLRLQSKQAPGEALKATAQQFESLFVNMLLKSMRDATPADGMFDNEQTRMYTEMMDRQLSQKMATTGKGLGLADMLVKQLSRFATPGAGAENLAADSPAPVSLPIQPAPPTPLPLDPYSATPRAPASFSIKG